MYITFDYRCTQCGYEDTRMVKRPDMDEQFHYDCTGPNGLLIRMIRLPAGTRTTFRFADKKLKP